MKRSNEYPTNQHSKSHRIQFDDELNVSHVEETFNESSANEVLKTKPVHTNENLADQLIKLQGMQNANGSDIMSHVNVWSNESSTIEIPKSMGPTDNEKFEPTTTSLKGSSIKYGCSFSSALDHDYAFTDKSLFVEAVITNTCRSMIVTAPRRMGKSFNLNILREFYSPCDPDGKARNPEQRFKGLKIMNEPHFSRVKRFMGKHPVVYLNLDRKTALCNLDDVKSLYRCAVIESHREHLYLLKSVDPDLFIQVEAGAKTWMLGDTAELLDDSLKMLTQQLQKYHGNECVFVVDGYDTILTQIAKTVIAMKKEKNDPEQLSLLERASDFILGALDITIKGNDSVRTAVIAGITAVACEARSGSLNDVERFRFLRNSQFYAFFGLLENEYEEVVTRFKNDDCYRQEAKELYNGYRYIDVGKNVISLYNPWATYKYAGTPASERPPQAWCETGTISATSSIYKIETVRKDVLKIIEKQPIVFTPVKKITYEKLITLAEMCESPLSNMKADIDLYYTHLLDQGYLTAIKIEDDYITAKVPNDEIKKEFVSMLRDHTTSEYGIQVNLIPACSELIFSILNLLESKTQEPIECENQLHALFEILKELYTINEEKTNLNEFVINCVSYFIGNEMTKKQNCHVDGLLYCRNGITKDYLDVAYSYNKSIIIFENKLRESVRVAIEQIVERDDLSAYKEYQFILIGSTLDYCLSKSYKLGYLINSTDVNSLKILE